ncbi:putative reverse transcriptase domain-containing protein [Tanacetum coccineum]
MTRSTVKRLTKPLDEPEREFRRLRKAAIRSHQNESLAITRRNLFDDEASSSNNTGAKLPTPPKTLHKNSCTNSSGSKNEDPLRHIKNYLSIVDNIKADEATRDTSRLRFFYFSLAGKAAEWLDRIPLTQITIWDQLVSRFLDHFFPVGRTSALRDLILRFKQRDDKPIRSAWIHFLDLIKQVPHHEIHKWLLVQIFHDNVSRIDRKKLDQFTQFRFSSLTKEEGWNKIEEYVQYQDDLWEEPSPSMNVSSISEAMQPTLRGCLKRAYEDSNKALTVSFYPRAKPVEPLEWKTLENRLKPSSMEPPKLELKELPEHLEYAFLQDNNQLPVVISSALSTDEKTRLLEVLQNHKGAIAWSIADIKGINSSLYTYKILMEYEFKPSVQPQRRVNPNIKEVVKKEVIKLLHAGLIYPISDSLWVSPVHVVPKKGG